MRIAGLALAMVAVFMMSIVSFTPVASAEEAKVLGVVTKIDMTDNAATVTLKDNKTEKEVEILVTDQETLDKFRDKRIVVGDEIRCKYEAESGKNRSRTFRKTAGC